MKRCLELARLGMENVAPNPMVGCVIVHEGEIIGEGYHEKLGEAHAEVNAIASVSNPELLLNSSLYVNLEPCNHIGKTPACTDLILKSGIPEIVVGAIDVNKHVSGGGVESLRKHNRTVTMGVLERDCLELNKRFFTYHSSQRPYIILKWAQSKDGFIAPLGNEQRWITGEESKRLVHKWRTEEQAILVGTNTVVVDNPKLTARLWAGNNPIRITMDKSGRIPSDANIFNADARTIIYGAQVNQGVDNVEYVSVDQIDEILVDLHKRDILSVIVEGGQQLLNSFIDKGLWDEARVFSGPADFVDGLKAPELDIVAIDEEMLGADLLRFYVNK